MHGPRGRSLAQIVYTYCLTAVTAYNYSHTAETAVILPKMQMYCQYCSNTADTAQTLRVYCSNTEHTTCTAQVLLYYYS